MLGAGAGVFEVIAARAVVEIEVEALHDRLGPGLRLDLEDGGDVLSGGEGLVGDQDPILLGEGEPGWGGALSTDGPDGLFSGRDDLVVMVEEGDLHFPILGDKEFGVWLDAHEHLSAVRTGDFRCMIVPGMLVLGVLVTILVMTGVFILGVFVAILVMPGVFAFLGVVMTGVFIVLVGGVQGKGDEEGADAGEDCFFQFHGMFFGLLVLSSW